MIELYTGTVGSGKSLHALYRGINQLKNKKKKFVVANYPITFTAKDKKKGIHTQWHYVENERLTPKYLIDLSVKNGWNKAEGYCLLTIDEAGIFFNARDWQISGEKRKEWIKFFSQCRKFGYDVIMIAQDARMIDRQIRSMAEYDVKHVKLRNYKWFKLLPIQMFAAVSKWTGGEFGKQLEFYIYKPWVAKRYDTFKLFDIQVPTTN